MQRVLAPHEHFPLNVFHSEISAVIRAPLDFAIITGRHIFLLNVGMRTTIEIQGT